MKYYIDKNEFVVASDHIAVHTCMSQQNVANSIDNGYFSVNLVAAFWPKAATQTPEYRRHSLILDWTRRETPPRLLGFVVQGS